MFEELLKNVHYFAKKPDLLLSWVTIQEKEEIAIVRLNEIDYEITIAETKKLRKVLREFNKESCIFQINER